MFLSRAVFPVNSRSIIATFIWLNEENLPGSSYIKKNNPGHNGEDMTGALLYLRRGAFLKPLLSIEPKLGHSKDEEENTLVVCKGLYFSS